VLAVEVDRVDGAGGQAREVQGVAHASKLVADPGGHGLVEGQLARRRLVGGERIAELVAREVRGFASLLDVHAELHHVQEEL
jgi:hypothetical protein